MKALFAYHRHPLCNTEDNYFMKSLVYRGICILCVVSACGGSGYFTAIFPFFTVSCRDPDENAVKSADTQEIFPQ